MEFRFEQPAFLQTVFFIPRAVFHIPPAAQSPYTFEFTWGFTQGYHRPFL